MNAPAQRALTVGRRSLLPVGVVRVEGSFQAGDIVSIVDETGREFARGVVTCDSREAALVIGHRTDQVRRLVGRSDLQELVHRDNLVLMRCSVLGVQCWGSAGPDTEHPTPNT